MALDRRSKIKDVWRHPVGHDLLQLMLLRTGRNPSWALNPLVVNRNIKTLDRMGGDGFVDMLLELTDADAETAAPVGPERRLWWKEAVFYEIFLPSFMDSDHDGVGDLGGVVQRLPYLEKLGVDVLWIWPLVDYAPDGGIRDYHSLCGECGGPAELAALVQAAHDRDMRVVMGFNIAATSDQNPWFCDAVEGKNKGYYVFRPGNADVPPNNWTRAPRGSAWKWVPEAKAWALRLTGTHKMDLNWEDAGLRKEMAGVLRYWMEKGIDGFCLGSANLIGKAGFEDGCTAATGLMGVCGYERYGFGSSLHDYLKELRGSALHGTKDGAPLLVGEVRDVGTETAKLLTGSERGELDVVYEDGHLANRPLRAAKPLGDKAEEPKFELSQLKEHYLHWMRHYGAERWMMVFQENAHTQRMVSRVGASPVYRGILAKLLGTMLLTLRGIPVVYQGQELGLTNTHFTSAEELRDRAALRVYNDARERQDEAAALARAVAVTHDHARTPMP